MAKYDLASMIFALQDYANMERPEDGAVSPEVEQAMERLVASCALPLRELRALLRAHRRLRKIAKLMASLREEYELCFKEDLPFEGEMLFLTEQSTLELEPFAGPLLRANTLEEAEARATLLGLRLQGTKGTQIVIS